MRTLDLTQAIRPIGAKPRQHDDLLELIGDAPMVLIPEATHGTHEFYQARAEITKRLIAEKGFTVVGVEGDQSVASASLGVAAKVSECAALAALGRSVLLRMCIVRRMKLGYDPQIAALAQIAGALYSRTVASFWRTVRKGVWLKSSSLMRWHTDPGLHAHSADAVVQQFFGALKSWRKRRKDDPNAHPPRRRHRFARLQWKNSAIRVRGGALHLSNGKQNRPLLLPWAFDLPTMVEIGWDGREYELRAIYRVRGTASPLGSEVAGIDLGEIHLAVACDGTATTIANGGYLRAKRRYQNKLKGPIKPSAVSW